MALFADKPLVALESTVIAHGLPRPINLQTARRLEDIVRQHGAVPATIAVLDGVPHIGLNDEQLKFIAESEDIHKISRRDLPIAVGLRRNCATTVATTIYFAHRAGIRVMATGGIGGVHRGYAADVSADLPELAQTPITVVCSGAKIILDLPATREWLETNGITVIGFECDEMPAFYSRRSGLPVDFNASSAADVAAVIEARDALQNPNAILVTAPVPPQKEIPFEKMLPILEETLQTADKKGIKGRDTTPFLLSQMAEKSSGSTLQANIALLENNARIAAQIALALIKN